LPVGARARVAVAWPPVASAPEHGRTP